MINLKGKETLSRKIVFISFFIFTTITDGCRRLMAVKGVGQLGRYRGNEGN